MQYGLGRGTSIVNKMPKRAERLTEVYAACFQLHLRPEEVDELFPGVASIGSKRQASQECGGFASTEVIDQAIATSNSQSAKHFDTDVVVVHALPR
jgi:hypothetical protein